MSDSLAYQFNNEGNIPFLRELAGQKDTFIEKITETMHIGLLPSALGKLKTGIQDNLNNKLRKYDAQLDGILVGYDNLALLGSNGHMIPGYYHIHINIRADFYVFKPKVGGTLTGTVLKKTGSNVTCLTNKVFTVFVTFKPHMQHEIRLHQDISFTIEKVDLFSQIPFVKGFLNENSLPSGGGGGSHARFDSPESAAAEPDSGVSSIGDEAAGTSADAPRPRKHKKRRDGEPEVGGEEAAETADEPSPRKSKKRRRQEEAEEAEELETSPRKAKKRRRGDAEEEAVVVKMEPASEGEQEWYLADPTPPATSHEKKKKRRRGDAEEEAVVVKMEPASEGEQEWYLADPTPPATSHEKKKKKKRRERAELNGSIAGMLR